MTSKIIAHGAEAKILKSGNFIIKDRIKKSYRIPELDIKIRKRRTKKEIKLLTKASKIINCPLSEDLYEFDKIKMPFINGKKLSKHLDNFSLKKQKQICKQIGKSVAKLHDSDIIHGDLTTSNMIYVPNKKDSMFTNGDDGKKDSVNDKPLLKKSLLLTNSINRASAPIIFFIDFGLGFESHKFEDKAVDLHLLRQALEAKHFKHWEILFTKVLETYKKSKNAKIVLERLKKVEKRGRYKH